jgi:hypothetical protein
MDYCRTAVAEEVFVYLEMSLGKGYLVTTIRKDRWTNRRNTDMLDKPPGR